MTENDAKREILVELFALLRAMHWAHWTAHWTFKGRYGDHLLFERMYEGMVDEIDGLAEKLVGEFGVGAVDARGSMQRTARILDGIAEGPDDLLTSLQAWEDMLLRLIDRIRSVLDDAGELSSGMDDYLGGLASAHETNAYLLQQRLLQDQSMGRLIDSWGPLAYEGGD